MESQPRRLWRKIGLEKNFLEGTSHSDQSKNSQFEQSFVNSETSSQSQRQNKSFVKTKTHFQHQQISNSKHANNKEAKNSLNVSIQSCETPINKLLAQSQAQSKYTLWEHFDNDSFADKKGNNKIMNEYINGRKNSQGLSIVLNNSMNSQNNISMVIESVGKLKQKDIVNENKSLMSQEGYNEITEQLDPDKEDKKLEMRIKLIELGNNQQKQYKDKQTYTGEDEKEIQQVRQMKEQLVMKQVRIQQLQSLHHKLTQTLPALFDSSTQLTRNHLIFKQSLTQSLTLLHNQLTLLIQKQFFQHISHLKDEIGYLYSQNKQLMSKIEMKQIAIKKLGDELYVSNKKLQQIDGISRSQINQSKETITELNNKIYSLQEKLQDLQEIQSQKEHLNNKIISLQEEILFMNNHNKQLQIRLNQQTKLLSGQLSTKQLRIQELINKQQQLQSQITRLNKLSYSLQEELSTIKSNHHNMISQQQHQRIKATYQQLIQHKQLQFQQNLSVFKGQLQRQRRQLQTIKEQKKELVFMRELMETLLGESLRYNSIQIVNKIQKQYSIKCYDVLSTMFAFIKEEIYHQNCQTNSNSNINSNSINSNNNNSNNNNSHPLSPSRNQSFGDNNESTKSLLRNTGYFGQVGGSRQLLLNIRLEDMQKNCSTEIIQQSQSDVDNEQHVRFVSLQREENISPIQSSRSKYTHMRHQSAQYKKLHPNLPPHPHPISNKDISRDLQIVKSGLRLSIQDQQNQENYYRSISNWSRNSMSRNQQLSSQSEQNIKNYQNKQYASTFSNPNYSFSEQNNNNQPSSFYKRDFDFGDQSFMKFNQQQQQKDHTRNNQKISQSQSSLYYAHKNLFIDRNNLVDEKNNTQRQDIIQKIKQRVKQKFRDSKSRSKHKQQQQQTSTNHYHYQVNQQPSYKLNFDHNNNNKFDNNKQSFYNKHSHQTSMISHNQPSYSGTTTGYSKTARPSLYTNYSHQQYQYDNNNIKVNTHTHINNNNNNTNTNVLTDFYERHKSITGQQQYQSLKLQDKRMLSPSSRLAVRSPTNIRPRSPSNSSSVAAKVNNKYVTNGGGYGMGLLGSNSNNKTVGPTIRPGFSRSMIEKPQFMGYSRKPPQTNTSQSNIAATYQAKAPSYSVTGRQLGSSFTKKY